MRDTRSGSGDGGFTLTETLVAVALLTTVALSAAQLLSLASDATVNARWQTFTAILAAQKMEQLRGLRWGFEDQTTQALPVSDTTTNLSTDPPTAGGWGLTPSPAGSLGTSIPGYVDYLNARGQWVGNGGRPPPGTVYVRRWAVQPLSVDPLNTLVLRVVVSPLRRTQPVTGRGSAVQILGETRLVTVKTRKAP